MVNEVTAIIANLIFDFIVLLIIFKVIKPKNFQKYIYPIKPDLTILLSITIYILSFSIFLFSPHINYSKQYDCSEALTFFIKSVIIAPIFEEILFRKVILNEILKTSIGRLTTIIVTSVLFAAFHLIYIYPVFKIYSLLGVFTFSLLVSDLYIRTNNLKLVILIHAASNFIGYFTPKILFQSKDLDSPTRVCVFISIILVFGFLHRFVVAKYTCKND